MIRLLSVIGRRKGHAVALLIVIAILLPPLGSVLRPWIGETVFLLLCVAFLRQDRAGLAALVRRPGIVIQATAWTLVTIPLLFIGVFAATGLLDRQPELLTILLYQAVASPMMAAPAMVALIGLDATLVLAVLAVSTLLVPLTAPVLAALAGLDLGMGVAALGLRLCAIVFGSMAVGWGLQRLVGKKNIERNGEAVDGFNILLMGVFVCAVMGDLGMHLLEQPLRVLLLVSLAFAIFGGLFLITFAVFQSRGAERAFGLSVLVAQRNMGLMYAATGGLIVGDAWLYFSVAQFPLYLTPLLLGPISRWLIDRDAT